MEKSKSIISWGQLFLIFGTACLFLFALTQRVIYTPQQEIVYLTGYKISNGAIVSYSGADTVVEIPSTYSLGPTSTMEGKITFNYQWQAFDFLDEYYAQGVEGYYDFYRELLSHSYPWEYEYSLEMPSFIAGNDFEITGISERAFSEKKNIEKVVIPSTIQSIGNFAFQNCSNLKEVVIEEGLTFLGDSSFWGCGFKQIKLPDTLETIYPYAFFWCKQLETITIPKNVKNITLGTFNGCEKLKTATILPEHDISIWGTTVYDVFSNCTSLTDIFVPANRLQYYKTADVWSKYSSKYKSL